ncbi:hypothetical protein EON66_06190 [archaeon]|nr:MAG: hypothetical protein EON66_06190 [archaeon]
MPDELLVTHPANASVVLLLTTSSSGTPSAHARASVVGALAPADSVPPSNNKLVRVAPYTWLSDKQAVRLAVARCILRAAYRMYHTRSRFGQQISFGGAGLGVDVDMQSSAASVSTLTGMLPQQLFGLVQQTRSAEAMFHSLMSKYDERTGDMLAKYAQQQDRLLGLLESYIPTGLPPAAAATMGGTATAALSPAMTAGHRSPMARVLHTPGGDVWSSSPRSVMSSAGGAGATLSAPAPALTVPRHSRVTLLLPSAQLCSNASTQRAITASDAMGADTRDPLDCIMHDGGETFVSACAACGDGGGPTLCAVTDGATVWCTSIPAPPTTLLYCQLPLRSVGAASDGGMSVSAILLGTQDGFIAAYARDDGATLLKPMLAKRSPVRHMAVRSAHNAADGNARLVVVYASGALRQWRISAERTLEGGVALRCVLDLDLDVCDLLALAHTQGTPFSSAASDERGLAYDLWRVRPSDCADNAASTERLRVTLRARRAISASPAPGLQPSPPARAYEYDVDMKAWVEA